MWLLLLACVDSALVKADPGTPPGSEPTGTTGTTAPPTDSDPGTSESGAPTDSTPAAPSFSCFPAEEATTDGGGRCEDLAQAWTARGINVGYFPFRVIAPIEQYSGDYAGSPGVTFTPGGGAAGVILQVIPAGSFVGLSSSGPWYTPDGECFPDGTCGSTSVDACADSAPPLRPGVSGFYWGYAYQGASHMQGWIAADPTRLAWAGDDPTHPCATGPAAADYEVSAACGAATTCSGENRTCGAANPCTEGSDDCGSTTCGAQSGGALTPSAHRATVTLPPDAVDCAVGSPPDPRVKCLPNGDEIDFFYVYPHGAYLYWAQNSTTKAWLHYGDTVQAYFHTRDAQGVLWDFVEVLSSGAPTLTPPSDGAGAGGSCGSSHPEDCTPCRNGGTCGWIQDNFLR